MPEDTPTYYLLVDDDEATAGTVITDEQIAVGVTMDPCRINLSDYADAHDVEDYLDLITNATEQALRLAVVTPNADVRVDRAAHAWCASWTIVDFEPYHRLFGRDAERLLEIIDMSRRELVADTPRDEVYREALRALGQADPGASAFDAARRALAAEGLDDFFWDGVGFGAHIIALIARPYIRPNSPWDVYAYYELTRPWTAAFGEAVHRDDIL